MIENNCAKSNYIRSMINRCGNSNWIGQHKGPHIRLRGAFRKALFSAKAFKRNMNQKYESKFRQEL